MKAAYLLLLACAIVCSQAHNCQWEDPNSGDNYDFSALNKPGGWQVVDKSTD